MKRNGLCFLWAFSVALALAGMTGCVSVNSLDGENRGSFTEIEPVPAKDYEVVDIVFTEARFATDDRGKRGDVFIYQALLKEAQKIGAHAITNIVIDIKRAESRNQIRLFGAKIDQGVISGEETWYGSAMAIRYTGTLTNVETITDKDTGTTITHETPVIAADLVGADGTGSSGTAISYESPVMAAGVAAASVAGAGESGAGKKQGFLSAGGGVFFGSDFGGRLEASANIGGTSVTMSQTFPYFGAGGFAFFDVRYAELLLGLFGGGGTFTLETPSRTVAGATDTVEAASSVVSLDIGLLVKYPFAINGKFSLFPALGITYRAVLSAKDNGDDEYEGLDGNGSTADFSALWFNAGGGFDYALTDSLYLRVEALYGWRGQNKAENDIDNFFAEQGGGGGSYSGASGLTAKLAVGYRF